MLVSRLAFLLDAPASALGGLAARLRKGYAGRDAATKREDKETPRRAKSTTGAARGGRDVATPRPDKVTTRTAQAAPRCTSARGACAKGALAADKRRVVLPLERPAKQHCLLPAAAGDATAAKIPLAARLRGASGANAPCHAAAGGGAQIARTTLALDPRAVYEQNREAWCAHARIDSRFSGRHDATWLRPAPPPFGEFGLGCCVCAAARANVLAAAREGREATSELGRRAGARFDTKWARYGIHLPPAQAYARISQHACSATHKTAVASIFSARAHLALMGESPRAAAAPASGQADSRPLAQADCHPAAAIATREAHHDEVFKGRVPPPGDWVDAWAEVSEGLSFSKQERMASKRGPPLGAGTGKGHHRSPKQLRKRRARQLAVMAEVEKQRTRAVVGNATSISLAFDAKGARRVVRLRAETAVEPYAHTAVLGIVGGGAVDIADYTDDYAIVATRRFDGFFRSFFTPLGGEFDAALHARFEAAVRTLSADGGAAERRILYTLLRRLFPNVIFTIRDVAHAMRIACNGPLQADEAFGLVWREIFDQRHALVPDIQNSAKWTEMLQAIQRNLLEMDGGASAMDKVLRHFAFAKQRFDSGADPAAKVCLLLLPVVALLGYVASDVRNAKPQRERAVQCLRLFTPRFCTSLGLTADYSLVALEFIRLFDLADHDVAKSVSEFEAFESRGLRGA